MEKNDKGQIKQNNAGFTLVEMTVTFALLALFMVAVTRVISYTVMLYHSTQASANGLEISGILSNRIIGIVENASEVNIADGSGNAITGTGYVRGNSLQIVDESGNTMLITLSDVGDSGNGYVDVQYENTTTGENGLPVINTGEWKYDENVYMGFTVSNLLFEKGLTGYPEDVIKMSITLHNGKYGNNDYKSEYYMKYKEIKENTSD